MPVLAFHPQKEKYLKFVRKKKDDLELLTARPAKLRRKTLGTTPSKRLWVTQCCRAQHLTTSRQRNSVFILNPSTGWQHRSNNRPLKSGTRSTLSSWHLSGNTLNVVIIVFVCTARSWWRLTSGARTWLSRAQLTCPTASKQISGVFPQRHSSLRPRLWIRLSAWHAEETSSSEIKHCDVVTGVCPLNVST